ncbi:O-antigen ligase family protein [Flavitalea sp.]|nr:O-antigen ligase family protein [Flavitalea sp.]
MSTTRKILKLLFLAGLFAAGVVFALLIASSENLTGLVLIAGILGIAVGLCAVLFPEFGFYFSIGFSFLAFDLNRLVPVQFAFISLIDLLILATFLGILLKKLISKQSFWLRCNHLIIYIYLVYAAYTFMQILNPNAVSTDVSISIVRKYFNLLLILYCAVQIFKDVVAIKRFFDIWLFFSFLCASYGCYQAWFGYPGYEYNYIMSDSLLIGLYTMTTGELRIFSSLSDPKNFGLLMAACAMISLVLLLQAKNSRLRKFVYVSYTLFFLLGMSYSGTRTANFMLVMGMVLYIMMTIFRLRTVVFTSIAAMAFIVILYGPIYGNNTVNRIRSTFDFEKDESYNVRNNNRQRIQPYIYEHPMGGGLGTTGIDNLAENASHPLAGFPPDSGYLLTALEAGWLGLLIQMCVYFIILQQGVRAYFRVEGEGKVYLLAAIMPLFGFMIAQYAQVSIGQPPGLFLYYAAIAIIIVLRPQGKNQLTGVGAASAA